MAGNVFITIALATALQYLWGMVNALQIIVLEVFFFCETPANAKVIMIEILKSCNFEVFDGGPFFELLKFKESKSFTEIFEEANYEGSVFIEGLGSLFFGIMIFPIYILIHSISKRCCKGHKRFKFIKNFIRPKSFLMIYMVFMLEGCIELGLTGSVSVIMLNSDRVSNFSEFFSTVLAIFFCISLIIAPIYTFYAGC